MKTFRLSYTMTIDLTAKLMGLDDTATDKDVERVIDDHGGWLRVLHEWNLDYEAGEGHVFAVEPPDLARKPSGDL